jgi:hypothetical protein
MAVRSAALALGASVLLLAGCGPAPEMPAPLTDAEAAQRAEEGNAQWWASMFPGEPQPVVEPVEYLTAESEGTQIQNCLKAAKIDGLIFSGNDSWGYAGSDAEVLDQINRQYFVCALQYPYDPGESGFLSEAQLEWVYNYNQKRLVPCLQLMGYTIANRTSDYVAGSNDYWIPYFEMYPIPSATEWARIDLRCPPSPIGPLYRP